MPVLGALHRSAGFDPSLAPPRAWCRHRNAPISKPGWIRRRRCRRRIRPRRAAALAAPTARPRHRRHAPTPPAQRIAIAQDPAFAFAYPHILQDWRAAGAEICSFLAARRRGPAPDADLIFLPGGYPELHAGTLAANARFLDSLADSHCPVYGECGGYMVLGEALTDADGTRTRWPGCWRSKPSSPTASCTSATATARGHRALCWRLGGARVPLCDDAEGRRHTAVRGAATPKAPPCPPWA